MKTFKLDVIAFTEEIDHPLADMCRCSICGWKGKVSKCETEWESDGWEYQPYQIHLCPKCKDGGCIDDYYYSKTLSKKLNNKLT